MLDAEGALMLTQWSLGHLEQIGFDGVILLAIAMGDARRSSLRPT